MDLSSSSASSSANSTLVMTASANGSGMDPDCLEGDGWELRYVEARRRYKDARLKNREQSKRARQLLAAVALRLQEKEQELVQVNVNKGNGTGKDLVC